jgi:hypothetical protein
VLGRIEEVYALSPEEEDVMRKMIADKLIELEAAKKPATDGKNADNKKNTEEKKAEKSQPGK